MSKSAYTLDRCATPTPLLVDEATGRLTYALCNRRRRCPRCARIYREKRRVRFAQGLWTTQLTLTMPPDFGEVTPANIDRMAKAWTSLSARLQRRYGRFTYAGVREGLAGEERLHALVLLTIFMPRCEQELISELAEKAGFGPVVDITPVHSRRRAVAYVVKSLQGVDRAPDKRWPPNKNSYFTNLPALKRPISRSHWRPVSPNEM